MTRWLRRIGFTVLVLGILYFAASLWVAQVADSRLEAELAAIRQRGEPLRLEDMAPPPTPDAENAAPLFAEVATLLEEDPREEEEALVAYLEAPFDVKDETVSLARAYVERNAEALAKIEEAVRRPACRFDPETHVMPLIDAGELLMFRAHLAARDGDLDAALEDVLRMLRMADLTGSDPVVILFLSRIVVEARALDGLEQIREHRGLPEAARETLLTFLRKAEVRRSLHRVLLGERCFGMSAYGSISGESTGLLTKLAPGPVLRLDQARYLRLMGRAIELAKRPYHETRDAWAALESDGLDTPWYGMVSKLILVNLTPIVIRAEHHQARLDMARITLGETVAEPDPFTGKPYEIRESADGGKEVFSPGADPDDEQDDIVRRLPSR